MKFHFKTQQGHDFWTNDEGNAVIGTDRESSQRDLYEAIERGDFPKWKMFVQIMPEMDAGKQSYNPFDLTKVWPHGEYPLIEVGEMELNRNPQNYFAEVEQASFSPSNVVPGIGFSPDKMLQARVFAYADAHRYRVGTHYEMLPVNRPRNQVNSYHRDGSMRFDQPNIGDAYYEPNRFGGPVEDRSMAEPPLRLQESVVARYDHRAGNDDYTQPGDLFRMFDAGQRERLFNNIAAAMQGVPAEIVAAQVEHFTKCDPAYGAGVAEAVRRTTLPANSDPVSAGTELRAAE